MRTKRGWRMSPTAAGLVCTATLLSGCLQTAPVIVTPQEQAARVLYSCPNNKVLDVTRLRANTSVIVLIDGNTLQLNRDTSYTAAERYTNRLQTLTLFGNGATYESLGKAPFGPCTLSGTVPGGSAGDQGSGSSGRRQRDSD